MDHDDWGCVEPTELFSSVGKIRPLRELFENIDKDTGLVPVPSTECFPLSNGNNAVKVISDTTDVGLPKRAPKILKKRAGLVDRPPCLKKVTFEEVERFAAEYNATATEKGAAHAQLAVSLGALPEKKAAVNYKQLKEDRKKAKENKEQDRHLSVLAPLSKKAISKKGKPKKSRK